MNTTPNAKQTNQPGSWQHYLPAAGYLSGFSAEVSKPARDSLLWVGRRASKAVWQTKASRVGAAHDIYTLPPAMASAMKVSPGHLDNMFASIEPRLAEAINEIVGLPPVEGRSERVVGVPANLWAFNAIPFAAQVFSRGIDFEARMLNRAQSLNLPLATAEHIAIARMMDFLWLAGAISRASWTVMHVPVGKELVTSDVARVRIIDPRTPMRGAVAILLRKDALLILEPDEANNPSLIKRDEYWGAGPIRHRMLSEDDVDGFNTATATQAQMEIYGSNRSEIERLHRAMSSTPPPAVIFEPTLVAPDPRKEMATTFLRIQKILESAPPAEVLPVLDVQSLDRTG